MEETKAEVKSEVKSAVSPEVAFERHVEKMQPRQLAGHLRRQARKKLSPMDGLWATVLSTVFENTAEGGLGKIQPFLR